MESQGAEEAVASLPRLPLVAWQMVSRLNIFPSRCVFVKVRTSNSLSTVSPSKRWE